MSSGRLHKRNTSRKRGDEEEAFSPVGERKSGRVEREVELLIEENRQLKMEVEECRKVAERIFAENENLRIKDQQFKEAKAEAALHKKQSESLRELLERQSTEHQKEINKLLKQLAKYPLEPLPGSRSVKLKQTQPLTPAETETEPKTPEIRKEVLEGRLKEIQQENLELRRRLAGLTPKTTPGGQKERKRPHLAMENENTSACPGCESLRKQKSRQADYFEQKLVESRQAAAVNKEKCKELVEEVHALHLLVETLQKIYRNRLEKLSDRAGMYKWRSERLERWNSACLKGLETDVKSIKSKVGTVEKQFVKTQLRMTEREEDEVINEQLGRLMVQSAGAESKLRALQRSLGMLEGMKL